MNLKTQINPKAIAFLKRLEKNNNRGWFNEHKEEYKILENEVKCFYTNLTSRMQETDQIDKLKMFRIYRDVRFSKDKTPYNTHFSGYFRRATAKLRGSYYLKIKSNATMIACGFWNPNKEDLFRIRKEFELDTTEIRVIINNKPFKKIWGNFVGDEVKSAPRGFDKKHKAIDLIKKKQFIFVKEFTNKEMLANDFQQKIYDSFKVIRPFFNYMSEILTTDLNGVSIFDE
ncbi:MAG: DUF2461 domain-containing protein [Flavobacteriaceae bacterium]|nr:DUF2461 domain-containing protein [Flavobacteriaceae bacterium]